MNIHYQMENILWKQFTWIADINRNKEFYHKCYRGHNAQYVMH